MIELVIILGIGVVGFAYMRYKKKSAHSEIQNENPLKGTSMADASQMEVKEIDVRSVELSNYGMVREQAQSVEEKKPIKRKPRQPSKKVAEKTTAKKDDKSAVQEKKPAPRRRKPKITPEQ